MTCLTSGSPSWTIATSHQSLNFNYTDTMGSASEPPRKIDVSKWNSTWDRIRENQAKQRAEAAEAAAAAAAELRDSEPRVDDPAEEE